MTFHFEKFQILFYFSDEEEEPITRRRRRDTRRNGKKKRMVFLISNYELPALLVRTLVDTSNSASPTTGRLPTNARSVN